MEDKTRLLKISKNKIHFTEFDFVNLNQTNFPENSLTFKHHLDTYLKVLISNYDEKENSLEVTIIDYHPNDINAFTEQKKRKPISKLIFKELQWSKLQGLTSYYKANLPQLIPQAFKTESKKINLQEIFESEDYPDLKIDSAISDRRYSGHEISDEIFLHEVDFKVLFTELNFHNGFVSTFDTFSFYNGRIEFRILNPLILPEHKYIKNYFTKYYKKDRINISAKIKIKNNEVLSIESFSEEIEGITTSVIDKIKTERILDLSKLKGDTESDKSTYTADEIFLKLDKSNNIFNQEEFDILNLIIENKKPRNIKQLEYLAGIKHDVSLKIRFTLNPLFGFIFFITGKKKNHIIWELLNSHATYVWSYEKSTSIAQIIKDSEKNLNSIRTVGRKKYRSLIGNKQIKLESKFQVINHSRSKTIDSFELWKSKFINTLN